MYRTDTLGSDVKRTRTSLMGLSMDVLQLLEDIEDVDFGDFDNNEYSRECSETFDQITRENTAKNSLLSSNSNIKINSSNNDQDDNKYNDYSTKIKKKLSESMHKINQIENVNMQKLAILEEMEHSQSEDDNDHHLPFNDDAQSDNDDAHSDYEHEHEHEHEYNDDYKQPLNRTRSKAKTVENINYLPKSYINNNDNNMMMIMSQTVPSKYEYNQYNQQTLIAQSQSPQLINYDEMAFVMKQQSQSLQLLQRDAPRAPPRRQKSRPPPPPHTQPPHTQPPHTHTLINDDDHDDDELFIQRPIKEVARLLYDLVDKSDRKYKLHTYTNCFIGRQAITVMEENNLCLHRRHGVQLCREMEELNIIHHVLYEKGNKFGDNKDSFYQFTIDDENYNESKLDLDVAFGLLHQVETKDLLNFAQNGNKDTINQELNKLISESQMSNGGQLPKFTKLPSTILQTLDLKDLETARKRHKSTISQFKETADKYIELPELSGWMEKKSAAGFRSWQKRWIIVRRTHILWSKQMMDTQNPLDPMERKKFNNSMTLLTIKQIRPVSSKRKRKFDIITAAKTYHFKCKTAQQRDLWLNGLNLHLKVLADSMKFLRQSFIFKNEN